jgi:hypothetical protein
VAQPDEPAHLNAFLRHRDELVRLGHLQRRDFEVPVKLGTPAGKELVAALIDKAESRPMCEWTPTQTMTVVKVYASAGEMPQWEKMLSRWDNVP